MTGVVDFPVKPETRDYLARFERTFTAIDQP